VDRDSQRRRQQNKQTDRESSRHQRARVRHEAEGQEVKGDDDGDGVEDPEISGLFVVLDGGGRNFTEEKDSGETNNEWDESEHEDKQSRVVGEESRTEVGEYGSTESDIAFENAGNRASVAAEVAEAGD